MKNIFFCVALISALLFSGAPLANTKREIIAHAYMYNPLTGSCFYAKINKKQDISEVKSSDCNGDEIQAYIEGMLNFNGQCNYLVALHPRLISTKPPSTTWFQDVCYEVKKPRV